MQVARIYLRVSTDEQDLTRQAHIEHSTRGCKPEPQKIPWGQFSLVFRHNFPYFER